MRAKKPEKPKYPKVIETFNSYISVHESKEPSCFNGIVNVRKYRVTVELVDEPNEVIIERIQKLWWGSRNHHDYQPLVLTAKQYGLELNPQEYGRDRKIGHTASREENNG